MNKLLLVAAIALLLGSSASADAPKGDGRYEGDSPDDDGNPCTAQPNDPRTPDYDESADDASCDPPVQIWSFGITFVGDDNPRIDPDEIVAVAAEWDDPNPWGGKPPRSSTTSTSSGVN